MHFYDKYMKILYIIIYLIIMFRASQEEVNIQNKWVQKRFWSNETMKINCSASLLLSPRTSCESPHSPVSVSNISKHLRPLIFSIFTCSNCDLMQANGFCLTSPQNISTFILFSELWTCISRRPFAIVPWKSNGNFKLNMSKTEL